MNQIVKVGHVDSLCTGDACLTPGQCLRTTIVDDECEDGTLFFKYKSIWEPKYAGDFPKPGQCEDSNAAIECPAELKVSFFGTLNIILAIGVILLIYAIIVLKNRKLNIIRMLKNN